MKKENKIGVAMVNLNFKSNPDHFVAEEDGRKQNTVRKIDLADKRFQELARMMLTGEYGDITLHEVQFGAQTGNEFTRRISHIDVYDGYMIISWRHG